MWKFGLGDLNQGKAETRCLPLGPTSAKVWAGAFVRLVGPGSCLGIVVLAPHMDPGGEPEGGEPSIVLPRLLRLQKADKDGAGFLGTVLSFSLFGNR